MTPGDVNNADGRARSRRALSPFERGWKRRHFRSLRAPRPLPARPEQPAMLTFTYPRSEHLCLIFTGSTVSISELQNFHAPGPALSKMHSGRLARWAINNLLYVLQMLHKRTVFYHGALTSGPLG